ncbi:MAG TPA: ester cyclase [Vicinamibacteria bacterium]|nr:ester cyclase [Vicinamibacteria bacterium]
MNLDVNLMEFFEATPDEVWEALTDREVLTDWLMPNDFVAEVGKTFTFVPDHPTPWEGDVQCKVLQLLPRKRMVWSWRTRGMKEPSRVEFELTPKKGGTELVFKHGGVADEPVVKGLEGGWPDMIDRLIVALQKRANVSEKNKRVVRRLYGEVMAKGNVAVADEIFDPGYVDHMPIMKTPDRTGLLASVDAARRAFPDLTPRIIAEIAEGDWVAIAVEVDAGTHQGPYMGVPASGKPVTWSETHFWRVKNGKIVEHYGNVSMFEIHKMVGSHNLNAKLA